jgi:hypothetical protein
VCIEVCGVWCVVTGVEREPMHGSGSVPGNK